MNGIKLLPTSLVQRHRAWQAGGYKETKGLLQKLASEGQEPDAMVVSCCDSRVHVTSIFGASQGDFFVHRNIANFVPAMKDDRVILGTAAALEYAVTALKVNRVIVVGHSSCGGVKGCHDMCRGDAPQLEEEGSFVGRWIDNIRPAYERVKDEPEDALRVGKLERAAVALSLENLMTYSFVKDGVEGGTLSLHGLWTDIGEGTVEQFDPTTGAFTQI